MILLLAAAAVSPHDANAANLRAMLAQPPVAVATAPPVGDAAIAAAVRLRTGNALPLPPDNEAPLAHPAAADAAPK